MRLSAGSSDAFKAQAWKARDEKPGPGLKTTPSRLTPFEKVLAETARRRDTNTRREKVLAARLSTKVRQVGLLDA